jgi:hypothetical protein
MDPRAGPDTLMKIKELRPTGNRTPSFRPSQSRYWLNSRFMSWALYVVMRGAGNYMVYINRLRAGFIYYSPPHLYVFPE